MNDKHLGEGRRGRGAVGRTQLLWKIMEVRDDQARNSNKC